MLLLEFSSVTNAGKIISESLSRSSFAATVKILGVGVVITRRDVVAVVALVVVVLLVVVVVVLAMKAGIIGAWTWPGNLTPIS